MPLAERGAMIELISDIQFVGLGLDAGRVWLIDVSEEDCAGCLTGWRECWTGTVPGAAAGGEGRWRGASCG